MLFEVIVESSRYASIFVEADCELDAKYAADEFSSTAEGIDVITKRLTDNGCEFEICEAMRLSGIDIKPDTTYEEWSK